MCRLFLFQRQRYWAVLRCCWIGVGSAGIQPYIYPFCFLIKVFFSLDYIRFCMGNKQLNNGNCSTKTCVFLDPGYIRTKVFTTSSHSILNYRIDTYILFFCNPSPSTMALMPNSNTTGIGVVLRTSYGNLVNCIAGTITGLTPLGAQLWSIHNGLRRAFVEGAESVIIETDNMQAFGAVQFAHLHQHPEYDDIIHHIITRIRDPNWECSFRFVYSVRNTTATYVYLLGGELFCRLYVFYEPIGRMSELMHLDMGLGPQETQFMEAPMLDEEWEAFDDLMADGAGMLAQAFMANMVLQGPGVKHEHYKKTQFYQ